jgi:hypothetical protein
MPDDFPNFEVAELLRKRARPPIDYRSRNTRLRLFGAVAVLILILALAERARDPASWNWLFGLKSKTEQREKPIDNRMARTETASQEPEIVFLSQENGEKFLPKEQPSESATQVPSPVQESWTKSWKAIWRDLGSDERTLVFRLVEAGNSGRPFHGPTADPDAASRAERVLESINGQWTAYQSAAFQEVGTLTGDDQARWVVTLEQVNARWLKELMPALKLVALGGTVTDAEQKTIAEFQRDLEQICLAQVRDDATFLRPDENQIWFHLLHELQSHSAKDLSTKSVGVVGYSAMHNQPEFYRGKLVTVKAQVRWVNRVPAINNYLGIKEFNVLYLAPEGVEDNPVVVYCLGLPPGFPTLKEQNHASGMMKVYEDVEVTGYFFKRGAYRGKDANYTAPLILANVPNWTPGTQAHDTVKNGARIWREALIISAVLFGIAALVVFMLFGRRTGRRKFDDEQARAAVDILRTLEMPPTVAESLKRMAQEPRDAK